MIEILALECELAGIISADNVEDRLDTKQKVIKAEGIFIQWIRLADHEKARKYYRGLAGVVSGNMQRVFTALAKPERVSFYETLSELERELPEFFVHIAFANLKDHFTPCLPAVRFVSKLPYFY